MTEAIPAVYEDGIFKPLQKVDLPEHKHVHLMVMPEDEAELLKSQKKALSKIIGAGSSGLTDVAKKHDQYLY
ncbi:MAG: antitoxin family protein [Methanosarcinales archaeon]|nr:antitoxin family protein [Methanosarcinales archaeon]MCD4798054.1 antitoxin family protein [Methanosarcinales archaeon]MCD4809633.1 antitoxin family protein [Methanosarcinales archaeon]MCD4816657.1 antitoxin family protein [Methanosarcinales archaeon]